MSKGLIDLISILDIEPLEVNLFRGNSPKTSWQRVFGGQVIGQAMVAACRTVEGRLPHSLHCYFILPGDPQIPIIYEVERLRDGKSYSTRRVTAIQHGNAIFSIICANGSPGSTSPAKVRNTGRVASCSRESVTTMSRIGCALPAT